MDWSFVAVGSVRADVDLPAGELDIEPAGDNEVQVSLEPLGSGSRRAEELIAASTVAFEDGRLRVHVPSRIAHNTELRCVLSLPERSALSAKAASADIRADCPLGDFSAAVASGDVTLAEVAGELVMSSASGDLRCRSVSGRLKVKAASADVTVGTVTGPVEISLASGDVELSQAAGDAKINTASGDIKVGCVAEGRITLRSASGDISVGVAEGANAYLDVTTVSGDLSSSLPLQQEAAGEARLRITCHTMTGDIEIHSAVGQAGRVGHG